MTKNVIEYLEQSAEKHPNKIAFSDIEKTITFSELMNKSQVIATQILAIIGERKNLPIAVYLAKGVDAFVAFMAIVYSGNFYVPLDINSPKERTINILNKLQPALVITANLDKYISQDFQTFSMSDTKQNTDKSLIEKALSRQIDTDPLYVMFTSGSTGVPKGVTINHRSVIDYVNWLTQTFDFSSDTVFGNQAPLHFDNSVLDIYVTLKLAATTVFLPDNLFSLPSKLLSVMGDKNVNTIFWVPSAITLIVNRKNLKVPDNLNLKYILFCGEVMPVKTLNMLKQFYPNAYYANLYGPTEITDVCCYYQIDRDFSEHESLPIGKACNNTEILLINSANNLVRTGEIGELCVRGSCLSLGYYNDNEKTNSVFVQNPLHDSYEDKIYRTGDLAKYNERGEIIFMGRKDSQIKHMGYRIELGELEVAASAYKKINELASFYDDEKQRIILFCSCKDDMKEIDLIRFLETKVPSYMLPARIMMINDLPHTPNGKVDRAAIKNKYLCEREQ